jgi:hypothetical protein
MSVNGGWILHFSWGCTSSYSQTEIDFSNNGTFGGPFTGRWVQQDGTLLLSFDGGPAKYGGTVDGDVGSGASSTFAGLNGCWYLTRKGTVGIEAHTAETAAQHRQSHDVSGSAA